jgi:hypothetical protein
MRQALLGAAGMLALLGAFYAGTMFAAKPAPVPARLIPQRDQALEEVHALGLQKTCAEGAAAFFKASAGAQDSTHLGNYQSHYNRQLRKCFILTMFSDYSKVSTTHASTTFYMIVDVFESKEYGHCYETFSSATREISLFGCSKGSEDSAKPVPTLQEWQQYSREMMND